MSVVFIVVPAVVTGWPILCGAIAGAAASLGYAALKQDSACEIDLDLEPAERSVEVSMDGSQVVAEAMARESQFVVTKGDVTATFRREADGRCSCHVAGAGKTEAELDAIGRELVGRVTQQYAYNKTMTELKKAGLHGHERGSRKRPNHQDQGQQVRLSARPGKRGSVKKKPPMLRERPSEADISVLAESVPAAEIRGFLEKSRNIGKV